MTRSGFGPRCGSRWPCGQKKGKCTPQIMLSNTAIALILGGKTKRINDDNNSAKLNDIFQVLKSKNDAALELSFDVLTGWCVVLRKIPAGS